MKVDLVFWFSTELFGTLPNYSVHRIILPPSQFALNFDNWNKTEHEQIENSIILK
jgi:hypothetical protein